MPAKMDSCRGWGPTLPLPSPPPSQLSRGPGRGSHGPVGQDSHPCRALKRPAGDLFFAALVSSPLHVPGRPSRSPLTPAASSRACEDGPSEDQWLLSSGWYLLHLTLPFPTMLQVKGCHCPIFQLRKPWLREGVRICPNHSHM